MRFIVEAPPPTGVIPASSPRRLPHEPRRLELVPHAPGGRPLDPRALGGGPELLLPALRPRPPAVVAHVSRRPVVPVLPLPRRARALAGGALHAGCWAGRGPVSKSRIERYPPAGERGRPTRALGVRAVVAGARELGGDLLGEGWGRGAAVGLDEERWAAVEVRDGGLVGGQERERESVPTAPPRPPRPGRTFEASASCRRRSSHLMSLW